MSAISTADPYPLLADSAARAPSIGAVRGWSLPTFLTGVAILSLFAGLALACWQATGSVVPWDSKNHFYPMFRFLGDALSRGEAPFWNPYHFAGHPAVADPQSLIFTPTMALFAWLDPTATMQTFDAVIMAHVLAGGIGVLGLFSRRGWQPSGGILAAFVYMLGGSASARLQHTGMIISYSFMPLALWALESMLARRSWTSAVLFGIAAALMALGRDQVAFLFAWTLIGSLVWQVASAGHPLAFAKSRLPLVLLGGGIGTALLIVPMLLTLQFLGASNRPGIAFGVAATGSLAPVNLITLLAPNVFGSLDTLYDYWGPGYETVAAADWTDRAVNFLFIGTVPVVLLAWHGLAGARLFTREARFFGAVALAALIYALGRYTPVFGVIFDALPGVSLYRRPADASFAFNFALAGAAGYLLHRFVETGTPRFARVGWGPFAFPGLVVAGSAALVGGALAFSATHGHVLDALAALGGALALAGAVALALAWPTTGRARHVVALGLVAATGVELIWRDAASALNAEPASRYSVYQPQMNAIETAGLDALRRDIAPRLEQGERPRVEILGLGGAWQNASMVLKLENTLGYNPLRIEGYERAVGPGENAGDPNLRHFPGTFRGYRCRLATLLGLDYLVLDRPLSKLPRHFPRPQAATSIFAATGMYVYRLGKGAPRAYLATRVKAIEGDVVLSEHTMPEFDRTREALVEAADLAAVGPDVSRTEADPAADPHVAIAAYHDDHVVLDVDTQTPGVVVLHDIYYPGWIAKVDGAERPILRANVLFRGVEVPTGHHVVEFEFHPLSLANLGLAVRGLMHHGTN